MLTFPNDIYSHSTFAKKKTPVIIVTDMNNDSPQNRKKISQYFIRHYLNKAILKQIFLEPQTRTSLIKLFGVRPNTISEHINQLLLDRMIVESAPIKTGGRNLVTLKINNDHSYYAGVTIEGEKIMGIIMGLAGGVVYRFSTVNPQPAGSKEFMENTVNVVSHLLDSSPGTIQAICFAGEHFSEQDYSYHSEYINNHARVDFVSPIQKMCNASLKFQSGIYSRTLAERWFGRGKGIDNFVFFNLGTGVSAGIVHRSILNQGAYQIGGQLGHTRKFSDKKCRCGRTGCLETVASVWAVREFLANNPDVLGETQTGALDNLPLTDLLNRFIDSVTVEKNRKSVLFLMEMAEYWAVAIRNIVDVLAPKKIILGGTMLQAKSIILPLVENEINTKLFPFEDKNAVVEVSDLGEYNAAIGAATFLMQEFYAIPEPEYYYDLI